MPQNLEIKARLRSLKKAETTAIGLGARFIDNVRQSDTYFRVRRGRLKLREIKGQGGELIYYQRPNQKGSRMSLYTIYPVGKLNTMKRLKRFLRSNLQPVVIVKKTRRIYIYKNARIHLDTVRGLGNFLEFEVVVKKGKTQAARLMKYLRTVFKIEDDEIEGTSYSDLLRRKEVVSRAQRT